MPKAREIFDAAMALINERDSAGFYHGDVSDFEKNAPALINLLAFSMKYDQCIVTGTPVSDNNWKNLAIKTLDDNLALDTKLANGVMPYGLAALLVLEEDEERSKQFYSLYKEAEEKVLFFHRTGKRRPVTDVY